MNEVRNPASAPSAATAEEARRRRMESFTRRDDRSTRLNRHYSRFVGLMRWLLPSAALALAALLLAWPSLFGDAEGVFPGFGRDIGNTLRMTGARYLGVDSRDHPFAVTANAAVQDSDVPQRITLDALQAQFSLEDGTALHIEAQRGIYDRRDETLYLAEWVAIRSADGYELMARDVRVNLNDGVAMGSGAVRGSGSFGELTANGFRIDKSGRNLTFNGGVHLLMRPTRKAKKS